MIGIVALVAMNKTLLQSSTKERVQGTYLENAFESIVNTKLDRGTYTIL